MSDKNKFKFVKDDPKDDFLLENEDEEVVEASKVKDDDEITDRHKTIKRYVIAITAMLFGSALLVFFGLFWQDDYTSLMAIGDALWLAFGIEFAVGWFIFVYNMNIFSPIVYATKSLFRMVTGRKIEDNYYTYKKKIEDNQVPKFFIVLFFISSLILLIPAVIILMILY